MPKFKLKSVVGKLEDVPEAYRKLYVERDGKFHLDEVEIDDGAELRGALDAANNELRTFKLDNPVRAAALAAGVTEDSIDDVITVTRKYFDLRENKIVVLDEDGDPTALTPETFFGGKYREQRPTYYAPAGAGGGSDKKTISRADFDRMEPARRMAFFKEGGSISDQASGGARAGAPPNKGAGSGGRKQIKRADFAKMPPAEQMAAVKGGAAIVD